MDSRKLRKKLIKHTGNSLNYYLDMGYTKEHIEMVLGIYLDKKYGNKTKDD